MYFDLRLRINSGRDRGHGMKDWIKKALEESQKRQRDLESQRETQAQRDQAFYDDAYNVWGVLLNTVMADVNETGGLLEFDIKEDKFQVARCSNPRLELRFWYERETATIGVQYSLRQNAHTEPKGQPVVLQIHQDQDGELGIRTSREGQSLTPKSLTAEETSQKILLPLIMADLREVVKQGLVLTD